VGDEDSDAEEDCDEDSDAEEDCDVDAADRADRAAREVAQNVGGEDSDVDDIQDAEMVFEEEEEEVDEHPLHSIGMRGLCKFGCGALTWRGEGKVCCSGGKHILGPRYNPPMEVEYHDLIRQPHMSTDSRLLNSALAMATQCVFPNRSLGGLGFHEQKYGHVSLMGKVYCVMLGLNGNNAFENYLTRMSAWQLVLILYNTTR